MKKAILLLIVILPLTAFGQSRGKQAVDAEKQIMKFTQFYYYLNSMYVDTLDNDNLIEEAIKKVLAELDPHSSYSSAEEMKAISESFEGSFSGIGVEFGVLNDTINVVNTIFGAPAESVGVMPNDKIIEIDGKSAVGTKQADVPKLLRGKKGSIVEIGVLRRGVKDVLRFRITRDDIPIHTVDAAYKVDGNIGYIRVNRFAEPTMKEFREAFGKLGNIDGFILDLRGNGGGLLEQAIELSEFFLPAGSIIVSTEGRSVPGSSHKSRRNGTYTTGPLAVLIDATSASGSEIVAGAIQDWDRGIVIGQPSFGKGLVQRQVPLNDGSAVRITVARYHTPTGRVIQRPYEDGKSDDYYLEHIMRAYDANYVDSLNANAPVYYTLRSGRKVYGGGGITPDIIIPLDTTKNYSYWNMLTRAGVINEYVNKYLDSNRNRLKSQYKTFESFNAGYTVDQKMIADLEAAGKKQNIEPGDISASSIGEIKIHIKALIAQKLWSTSEYFRIVNSADDPVFSKGYEAVRNWHTYSKTLEKQ